MSDYATAAPKQAPSRKRSVGSATAAVPNSAFGSAPAAAVANAPNTAQVAAVAIPEETRRHLVRAEGMSFGGLDDVKRLVGGVAGWLDARTLFDTPLDVGGRRVELKLSGGGVDMVVATQKKARKVDPAADDDDDGGGDGDGPLDRDLVIAVLEHVRAAADGKVGAYCDIGNERSPFVAMIHDATDLTPAALRAAAAKIVRVSEGKQTDARLTTGNWWGYFDEGRARRASAKSKTPTPAPASTRK